MAHLPDKALTPSCDPLPGNRSEGLSVFSHKSCWKKSQSYGGRWRKNELFQGNFVLRRVGFGSGCGDEIHRSGAGAGRQDSCVLSADGRLAGVLPHRVLSPAEDFG